MAIAKIKSFIDNGLKSLTTPLDRTTNLEPEVGIRIVHSPDEKTLRVTVLGARHLPQNFGFTRVNCYVTKVKLFPGKEKFETTAKNESWPQWNEEFTFQLRKDTKIRIGKSKVVEEEIGASKLIIATVYAVLEDKPLIATEKKEADKDNAKSPTKKDGKQKETSSIGVASGSQEPKSNRLLSQFFGKNKLTEPAFVEKKNIDKRRVVGATTIPLDPKNFFTKPPKPKHPADASTGDLWKPLRAIASGISGADDRREGKKGQVEMILIQERSEKKDVSEGRLVLCLSRLRCSLQTMHEQEALKGQLYIKISVVEGSRVTHFWKSDRFVPSISLKFDQETARVIADNPYEGALKDVSFVVKFVSKNKIGKKTTVGHFVIGTEVGGSYAEQWNQAMATPGEPITKWQLFE